MANTDHAAGPTSIKRPKTDDKANAHTEFHTAEVIEDGQIFYATGTIPASDVARWNKLDVMVSLLWCTKEGVTETNYSKSGTQRHDVKGNESGKRKQLDQKENRIQEREKRHAFVIGQESMSGTDLTELGMSCCQTEACELNKYGR